MVRAVCTRKRKVFLSYEDGKRKFTQRTPSEHEHSALSESELSRTAATQRTGGVGDSAANVRRDLADNDCGDSGDCELCCSTEQAAGTFTGLFLLVAAAESRGSDNSPASPPLYSVARSERMEGSQRGV